MSVDPLFVQDRETLKAKLRLSGSTSTDAEAILDDAILNARIGFFDSLGSHRINKIKATPLSDNPSTAADIMRARAAIAEVKWVRMLLLRALPSLFVDGSGVALTAWNDEAMIREKGQSELWKEINRLQDEVNDALKDLTGEKPPDAGTIWASSLGPSRPPRPYDSIRPYRDGVLNGSRLDVFA